jgi:hypothetical protein
MIDLNAHSSHAENSGTFEFSDVPDYDYEDDSLDGRITLSDKGVHLAPIYTLSDKGVHLAPIAVVAQVKFVLRRVNSSRPSHKRYILAWWVPWS